MNSEDLDFFCIGSETYRKRKRKINNNKYICLSIRLILMTLKYKDILNR